MGEDFGIGVGEEFGEQRGFELFGAETLAEAPDGVDAGELIGFLVGGDGFEGFEVGFFDELELRTKSHALIAMREV